MATPRKPADGRKKKETVVALHSKKESSAPKVILPGSFLAKGGGMVPTVRLGKRASKKAI
jgi:hypothetical protein